MYLYLPQYSPGKVGYALGVVRRQVQVVSLHRSTNPSHNGRIAKRAANVGKCWQPSATWNRHQCPAVQEHGINGQEKRRT